MVFGVQEWEAEEEGAGYDTGGEDVMVVFASTQELREIPSS